MFHVYWKSDALYCIVLYSIALNKRFSVWNIVILLIHLFDAPLSRTNKQVTFFIAAYAQALEHVSSVPQAKSIGQECWSTQKWKRWCLVSRRKILKVVRTAIHIDEQYLAIKYSHFFTWCFKFRDEVLCFQSFHISLRFMMPIIHRSSIMIQ